MANASDQFNRYKAFLALKIYKIGAITVWNPGIDDEWEGLAFLTINFKILLLQKVWYSFSVIGKKILIFFDLNYKPWWKGEWCICCIDKSGINNKKPLFCPSASNEEQSSFFFRNNCFPSKKGTYSPDLPF